MIPTRFAALALVVLLSVGAAVLIAPTPAAAAPAATPTGLVQRFLGCVQAKACPATDVFSGKALKEWRREVEPMLGKKLVIHNASLVATVSQPKFARKWQRRWSKATRKLAAAGYDQAALSALGNGKGLVRIAPRVALALGTFDMTMRGRQRTEYLLLTMFKQADGWRIVYIEDSPGQHVRFLLKNKP